MQECMLYRTGSPGEPALTSRTPTMSVLPLSSVGMRTGQTTSSQAQLHPSGVCVCVCSEICLSCVVLYVAVFNRALCCPSVAVRCTEAIQACWCVCRFGPFVDGAAWFDPLLFGVNGAEADLMDPQQRLLLLCAHAAMAVSSCNFWVASTRAWLAFALCLPPYLWVFLFCWK